MIHRDQRLLFGKGESLRVSHSHQQRSGKSWTLRHRDRVNARVSLLRLLQREPHHGDDAAQVLARGDLRNHPAEALVRGDLREDNVREQLCPAAHHRGCGLVARGLDSQDDG